MDDQTAQHEQAKRIATSILETERDRWVPGWEMAGRCGLADPRALRRTVIWPLRAAGVPIHFRPGVAGGYKLHVTAEEHAKCLRTAQQMGRDFLAIYSILRRQSAEVVMAQLVLDFFPDGKGEDAEPAAPADPLQMLLARQQAADGRKVRWLDVVGKLLDVLAADPERYAAEIDHLRREHGGLFLTREQRAEARQHLEALGGLLQGEPR